MKESAALCSAHGWKGAVLRDVRTVNLQRGFGVSGKVMRLGSLALLLGLSAAIYITADYLRDGFRDPLPKRDSAADAGQLSLPSPTNQPATAEFGAPDESVAAHRSPATKSDAFLPGRLYAKYKDEANSGDLHAQYVLMTVLDACLRGPRTAEKLAELKGSGLADETLQATEARFRRCQPLYEAVPQIEDEYNRRYAALRSSQHPLILVKKRQVPLSEKRRLVLNAVSERYPEPYLYADAYLEAAILYREYPEVLDLPREEAWLLLYCEASLACDGPKEREYLRTVKYHAHEYAEIIARYTEINAAIRRQDWAALEL